MSLNLICELTRRFPCFVADGFVVVTRYSTPTGVRKLQSGSSPPHCQVLPPVDSAMVSAALCAERAETAKKKAYAAAGKLPAELTVRKKCHTHGRFRPDDECGEEPARRLSSR